MTLSWLFQLPVALVLLFSGGVKAIDSSRFAIHLKRYGLLPEKGVAAAAVAIAGFEIAIGFLLLVETSPIVEAIAIILFASFIALTLWGASAKRIEDCGCYGNQMALSPTQSAALDALYIVMLGGAWRFAPAKTPSMLALRLVAAVIAGAIGTAVATKSRTKPLMDLSRLRPGVRWKPSWLARASEHNLTQGSHLVVFIGKTFSQFKEMVALLNILDTQSDLPRVTGVLTLNESELGQFSSDHLTRFPLAPMKASLFEQMVEGVPTAALIEDGVVKKTWLGKFPPELWLRIEQFYQSLEPNLKQREVASRFAG